MPQVSRDPATLAAGQYVVDPLHTSVLARADYLGMTYIVIRFNKVEGTLDWAPSDVTTSKVSIKIDPRAIGTPAENFDKNLMGPTWFDGARYTEASFVSTALTRTGPTTGRIEGDLTLKGVTKRVALDAEMRGAGTDIFGTPAVGFTAQGVVKRQDFGLGGMFPGQMLPDDVEILIDIQFVKEIKSGF